MVYKSDLSRASILNNPDVLEIYNSIKNLINLCDNSAQNENTIKETNSEEDITEKNILQLADELEKVKSDSSKMKIAAKKLEKDKTLLMEAVIKKLPKNIIKELLKYESGTVNSIASSIAKLKDLTGLEDDGWSVIRSCQKSYDKIEKIVMEN